MLTVNEVVPSLSRAVPFMLALAALVLALMTISMTHITDYTAADWGLVSRLPYLFWVGLGCTTTLLIVGRDSPRLVGIGLALVVIYLHAVPVFTNEFGIEAALPSYFLDGESLNLVTSGRLRPDPSAPLIRYHYWPGFLFLSSTLHLVTGLGAFSLPKYFPLANQILFALFTWTLLRRLLPEPVALLATLWAVVSNFYFLLYFGPQGQAALLTILLLFFIVRLDELDSPATRLLTVMMFVSIVITHYFTSLGLVFAATARALSRPVFRMRGPVIWVATTFIVVFAGYHVYVLAPFLEAGLRYLLQALLGQTAEKPLSFLRDLPPRASAFFYWTLIADFLVVLVNVLLGGAALIYALLRRDDDCFVRLSGPWLVGLAIAGLFGLEADGIVRAFILGVVPLAFLSVRMLGNRAVVALAVGVLTFLHVPAHYGNVLRVERRLTVEEVTGRIAYLNYAREPAVVFYQSHNQSWFSDPRRARGEVLLLRMPPTDYARGFDLRGWPNQSAESVIRRRADYVIDSKMQREEFKYVLGVDFLEGLRLETWNDRLYDNGDFRIFRPLARRT